MTAAASPKPRKSAPAPRRVMMLAYADAQILDIAGPLQILSTALLADGRPAYAVELVSAEPGPVMTTSGLALHAARTMDDIAPTDLATLDTLMVTGGLGSRAAMEDERILAFLRAAAAPAARVVSICTGSVILAAAMPARWPPRHDALGLCPGDAPSASRPSRWKKTRSMCATENSGHRWLSPPAWTSRWR